MSHVPALMGGRESLIFWGPITITCPKECSSYQTPIQLSEQSIMICHASTENKSQVWNSTVLFLSHDAGLSFHVRHFLIIDSMFSLPFED